MDTIAKIAAGLEIDPGELFEGIKWTPRTVRVGRFVATEVPGVGTVQRKIKVERPTKRGS